MKLGAGVGGLGDEADGVAFVFEEAVNGGEVEVFGDEGIVTDFGMGIEGKVATEEGAVGIEKSFNFMVKGIGEGLESGPK